MQYRTHLITTAALGVPLMAVDHQLTFINLGALAVGALLPDIDQPTSHLGRRHRVVSKVTHGAFGHRGMTHSLVALIGVYLIAVLLQRHYLTAAAGVLPFWLAFGYLAHLVEDAGSKDGVPWLWPLGHRGMRLFGGLVYYSTGKISEYLILGFMGCLLLIELRLIWLGTLTHLIPGGWLVTVGHWIRECQSFLPR